MQVDYCYEDGLLPLDKAIDLLLARINAIDECETVALKDSFNRILSEDVISAMNVPPHRNSAMDGYAYADEKGCTEYHVVGKSLPGSPFLGKIAFGECIRIMTGACMPEDTDTVVMQEHIERQGEYMVLNKALKRGGHVRHVGEDIQQGQRIFSAGRCLSAIDLGVLASIGYATVSVLRKPKVALFCTGDEIKEPGEVLFQGDIYNSNRYPLMALLEQENIEVLDLGVIPDAADLLEETIIEAAKSADVLLSTGGVSVGDTDYIQPLMKKIRRN